MTGRRLYDQFCDAARAQVHTYGMSVLPHAGNKPVAWSFLSGRDQRVWNDLARRIAPRRKAK